MKSLPAVVLSMFFLSIIYSEVSGKELKCFTLSFTEEEAETTCSEKDPVCVTYVDIETKTSVRGKKCGEREFIKWWCDNEEKKEYHKCLEPCNTDLCNNEKKKKYG